MGTSDLILWAGLPVGECDGEGFDEIRGPAAKAGADGRSMAIPHGHRKTTTLVAGLRNTGMVAPLAVDGPINGAWFEAYVGQMLVPTLKPGDVVILDNLSSHKRPSTQALIEAAGARLMFLPPYSPDFNPIEKVFSKLKALLRKAAGPVPITGQSWMR